MKFMDPFANLKYMGGEIPTHIGMAVYSITVIS